MSDENSTPDETLNKFVSELKTNLASCLSLARQIRKDFTLDNTDPSPVRLMVAISAGPDSTALLLALEELAQHDDLQLLACHVNHRLRGQESDQDETYCRSLCERLGIPFFVFALEPEEALPEKEEPNRNEEYLRERRYEFLTRAALANRANYIVTGHTLDDQAETVLFRLLRGTALKGLTGIPSCRHLQDRLFLIRPLLRTAKSECLKYLLEKSVMARDDGSNQDLNYTRNYIRHAVIPLIKERFPDFMSRLETFRTIASAEESFLAKTAEELYSSICEDGREDIWMNQAFNQLDLAMKRRIIALALEERGIEVSFQRVEQVLELAVSSVAQKGNSQNLDLDGNWYLKATFNQIRWYSRNKQRKLDFAQVSVKVPGSTILLALDKILKIEALDPAKSTFSGDFPDACAYEALVNLSHIAPPIVVRPRRPGDVIQPFGRTESVRLKKYLHTRSNKDIADGLDTATLPVLADANEVLWIPGIGLSEKLRADSRPTHRLSWLAIAVDSQNLA
jgi:tRNA(Ile)-lysidine synthase